jgi:phosphoribosylformylglycinamidine (FGAM) synthase-like amidotransferase family enzyme
MMEKVVNLPMRVAGVTFEGRQEMLKMFKVYPVRSISVELKREPFNKYDANAVQVLIYPGGLSYTMYHIGFIPKEYAKYLAPLMDSGSTFVATINEIGATDEGKYYCEIMINQL